MKVYLEIFKGDDSGFEKNQRVNLKLDTNFDLGGCKAHFKFYDYVQDFDEIPADYMLPLVFPSSETSKFPLGMGYAKVWLTDPNGAIHSVSNYMRVKVTALNGFQQLCDCSCAYVEVPLIDYNEIGNRPKLNGNTIEGDHDSAYYKIEAGAYYEIDTSKYGEDDVEYGFFHGLSIDIGTSQEQIKRSVGSLVLIGGGEIVDYDGVKTRLDDPVCDMFVGMTLDYRKDRDYFHSFVGDMVIRGGGEKIGDPTPSNPRYTEFKGIKFDPKSETERIHIMMGRMFKRGDGKAFLKGEEI